MEKAYEFNVKTYLCFVDYSKAFNCVEWKDLWLILKNIGEPEHIIILLNNFYNSCRKVKINNTSKSFSPKCGVRQGCILSPILFNIYGEYIMRKVLQGWRGGVTIGGKRINNLRYADDTLMLARSEEELTEIMRKLDRISRDENYDNRPQPCQCWTDRWF